MSLESRLHSFGLYPNPISIGKFNDIYQNLPLDQLVRVSVHEGRGNLGVLASKNLRAFLNWCSRCCRGHFDFASFSNSGTVTNRYPICLNPLIISGKACTVLVCSPPPSCMSTIEPGFAPLSTFFTKADG